MEELMSIRLIEAAANDVNVVGSKCYRLGELLKCRFRVPEAVCLTFNAFHRFLLDNPGFSDLARNLSIDSDKISETLFAELKLSSTLSIELDRIYQQLHGDTQPLIVRSSAISEDSDSFSFSGVYRSIPFVTDLDALQQAVIECWASYWHPGAVAYRQRMNLSVEHPMMALIVQQMVLPKASGVASSANVRSGNPLEIMVTAGSGFGEGIVSNGESGDQWVIDFESLDVLEYLEGSSTSSDFLKHPLLTGRQLKQIASLVRRVDQYYQCRMEIEWALAESKIWLLQARPLVNLPSYCPASPWPLTGREFIDNDRILNPLALSIMRRMISLDTPWPPEVEAIDEIAGRIIARVPEENEEPDAFLHRIWGMEDPRQEYRAAFDFLKRWPKITSELTEACTSLLSLTSSELQSSTYSNLFSLLNEHLLIDARAAGIYLGVSYPTYEYLRRVEYLSREWLGSYDLGDQEDYNLWAISLLQGAPKRSLIRDAELSELAMAAAQEPDLLKQLQFAKCQSRWLMDSEMDASTQNFFNRLKAFAASYGYSWAFRSESQDLTSWQSWIENPTPLFTSLLVQAQAYRKTDRLPYRERVQLSREAALQRRKQVLDFLHTQPEGERKAKLFQTCVEAADRHLPMKDERDLVLAHADSALRWVLVNLAQKLVADGILHRPQDLYLLSIDEVLSLNDPDARQKNWNSIVRSHRRRLKRYELIDSSAVNQLSSHVDEPEQEDIHLWRAQGAAPGVVEGRCYCIRSRDDLRSIPSDRILCVADEGMIGLGLYLNASRGIILESGNWLCHTINLCRELGIPAVVGAGSLVTELEHQVVQIDGAKGIIRVRPENK